MSTVKAPTAVVITFADRQRRVIRQRARKRVWPDSLSFAGKAQQIVLHHPIAAAAIERFMDRMIAKDARRTNQGGVR